MARFLPLALGVPSASLPLPLTLLEVYYPPPVYSPHVTTSDGVSCPARLEWSALGPHAFPTAKGCLTCWHWLPSSLFFGSRHSIRVVFLMWTYPVLLGSGIPFLVVFDGSTFHCSCLLLTLENGPFPKRATGCRIIPPFFFPPLSHMGAGLEGPFLVDRLHMLP